MDTLLQTVRMEWERMIYIVFCRDQKIGIRLYKQLQVPLRDKISMSVGGLATVKVIE